MQLWVKSLASMDKTKKKLFANYSVKCIMFSSDIFSHFFFAIKKTNKKQANKPSSHAVLVWVACEGVEQVRLSAKGWTSPASFIYSKMRQTNPLR